MGEERMALERFDNGDYAIMAPYPQIISLGDIVSENHSRILADTRKDGEQNSAL
jgi:hypothetical protein